MQKSRFNIILTLITSVLLIGLILFIVIKLSKQVKETQFASVGISSSIKPVKTEFTKKFIESSEKISSSNQPIRTPHIKKNLDIAEKAVRTVIVDGTNRKMYLLKHGIVEEVFPISIGAKGLGKRKMGDKKTPLGEYEISWMVSRHGNKGNRIIDGQTWCKNNTLYYGPSGPAGEKLWTGDYGGSEATVMGLNYPNEYDKKRGYTGSCIEIHSSRFQKLEPLQPSAGCIRMYPDDALKLYNHVDIGTKVYVIKNDQMNLAVINEILFSIPFPNMDIKEFLKRSIGYCPKDVIHDGLPNFGSLRDDWKGRQRKHKGYDIYVDNINVLSAADGRVMTVRNTKLSGPYVKVSHGKGLYTVYIHLASTKVKKGQRVKRGQVIGRIDGSAGNAVEPQLHFELEMGLNHEVDPLIYIKKYYSLDRELLNIINQFERKLAACKEKREKLLKKLNENKSIRK